jgi:catechol 2,3-dioxygenase-like lactoylglutathione lyase family enzyme
VSAPATRLLHCNHNCRDIETATRFYTELLDLRVVMRSVTEPGGVDGKPMGLDGLVETDTRFLYDRRGSRVAPALELVQWFAPPTAGNLYPEPNHVGLQALGFVTGDLTDIEERVAALGGTIAGPFGDGRLLIRDPEGLPVELVAGNGAARAAHVRLSCGDLERSLTWYRELGCDVVQEPREERWPGALVGLDHPAEVTTAALGFRADSSYRLELAEWRDPKPVGAPYPSANHRGLYRMALAVDDVRAAHDAALDRGCDANDPEYFRLPGTPIKGLWIAFLHDPDGIVVELVERPESSFGT